jgi:hypothetical protein
MPYAPTAMGVERGRMAYAPTEMAGFRVAVLTIEYCRDSHSDANDPALHLASAGSLCRSRTSRFCLSRLTMKMEDDDRRKHVALVP